MNLLRSLRRLDDAVLWRLGFDPSRRFARGGFVPRSVTVHLYPGEKIIGGEELALLMARETARLRARGFRP